MALSFTGSAVQKLNVTADRPCHDLALRQERSSRVFHVETAARIARRALRRARSAPRRSSKAERSGISREFQVAAAARCGDQSLPIAGHSCGAPVQFLGIEKRCEGDAARAFGKADLEIDLDGIGCAGL